MVKKKPYINKKNADRFVLMSRPADSVPSDNNYRQSSASQVSYSRADGDDDTDNNYYSGSHVFHPVDSVHKQQEMKKKQNKEQVDLIASYFYQKNGNDDEEDDKELEDEGEEDGPHESQEHRNEKQQKAKVSKSIGKDDPESFLTSLLKEARSDPRNKVMNDQNKKYQQSQLNEQSFYDEDFPDDGYDYSQHLRAFGQPGAVFLSANNNQDKSTIIAGSNAQGKTRQGNDPLVWRRDLEHFTTRTAGALEQIYDENEDDVMENDTLEDKAPRSRKCQENDPEFYFRQFYPDWDEMDDEVKEVLRALDDDELIQETHQLGDEDDVGDENEVDHSDGQGLSLEQRLGQIRVNSSENNQDTKQYQGAIDRQFDEFMAEFEKDENDDYDDYSDINHHAHDGAYDDDALDGTNDDASDGDSANYKPSESCYTTTSKFPDFDKHLDHFIEEARAMRLDKDDEKYTTPADLSNNRNYRCNKEKDSKYKDDGDAIEILKAKDIQSNPNEDQVEDAACASESSGSDEEYAILQVAKEEQWDCESILTTYSNLDNHPHLIGIPQMASHRKIILDKKLNAPKDYLSKPQAGVEPKNDPVIEFAVPAIRSKDETKEEKAARKKAVKEERRQRRAAKSATKKAFKTEFQKQDKSSVATGKAHVAVYF